MLAKAKERHRRLDGDQPDDSDGLKPNESNDELLRAKTLVLGFLWHGFSVFVQ